MASKKFDGVVEAVHYTPDGRVAWVRVFERRGPTFTDRIILDRKTLIERLKSGKNFVAGQRVPLKASTFETSNPQIVIQLDGQGFLTTGNILANKDDLEGIPVI